MSRSSSRHASSSNATILTNWRAASRNSGSSARQASRWATSAPGCVFKNPRGVSAGELIEKAGLKGTRIGGAVVSDRHANFILAEPEATSSDVLRLIELIRGQVRDRLGLELELELEIW